MLSASNSAFIPNANIKRQHVHVISTARSDVDVFRHPTVLGITGLRIWKQGYKLE